MPKIADIQTIPFKLPMAGALSWGQASRMEAVEHVLVRLISDTGHVGLAEATPRPTIYGETPESVTAIIRRHIAPRLLGLNLADAAEINRRMDVFTNNHTAKGAIDISLYDCRAAAQRQSLFEFMAPANPRVKVSYILGMADAPTMLAEARAVYDRGVRVLKVKVGRNFAHDLSLIKTLQAEFTGSGLWLYADANEGLLPEQAAAQLHQLAELGILYVEEPLPVELIPERAALRALEALPIIADDSAFTRRDLNRELRFNTFDILNIKTARTGYTHSRHMLKLALAHDKGVMVGSQASSTLGTIRAAMFAGLEGIEYPSELSFFLKLEDDIVNRPITLQNGYLDLTTLADITLDETRLKKFSAAG